MLWAMRDADHTEWIVDKEIAHPKLVPTGASLMQLVFLLSGDPSAPVDGELQEKPESAWLFFEAKRLINGSINPAYSAISLWPVWWTAS
jgi:hypothetical protein